MTKIYYITMVILAAVLAGCSKNPSEPDGPRGPHTANLTVSLENVRAATDTDGKMTWQEGDQIAVLCGDMSVVPFTLSSGAGSASATFTGELPEAGMNVVMAGYPYGAGIWYGEERYGANMEYLGLDLVFTPSVSGVPWKGNSKVLSVMKGNITGDAVSFAHQGGVLHFSIGDIPAGARKFKLTTSGNAVYGRNAFTLDFTPAAGMMDFYIPVSPGTIPSYTISLCDAAGNAILTKTKSSPTTISRCELKSLTPLQVVEASKLRILCYNVQDGMVADMANNYDNFVAWINTVAPDILVLCEAENSKIILNSLASRWGHSYTAMVKRDSYPVVITSSRPMSTVKVLDNGTYVGHGAVYVSVAGLNLVGLHLRPTLDNEVEPNKYEYYGALRVAELDYILGETILSPSYSSRSDWMFLGDYNMMAYNEKNATGPIGGNAYYYPDYDGQRSVAYNVYDNMCATGLTDVLYRFNGTVFQPTMYHGRSRLDYIFASTSLYRRIRLATVVTGGFPGNYVSSNTNPSDHLPLLVELNDYAYRVLDGKNRLEDWGEDGLFSEDFN